MKQMQTGKGEGSGLAGIRKNEAYVPECGCYWGLRVDLSGMTSSLIELVRRGKTQSRRREMSGSELGTQPIWNRAWNFMAMRHDLASWGEGFNLKPTNLPTICLISLKFVVSGGFLDSILSWASVRIVESFNYECAQICGYKNTSNLFFCVLPNQPNASPS